MKKLALLCLFYPFIFYAQTSSNSKVIVIGGGKEGVPLILGNN